MSPAPKSATSDIRRLNHPVKRFLSHSLSRSNVSAALVHWLTYNTYPACNNAFLSLPHHVMPDCKGLPIRVRVARDERYPRKTTAKRAGLKRTRRYNPLPKLIVLYDFGAFTSASRSQSRRAKIFTTKL